MSVLKLIENLLSRRVPVPGDRCGFPIGVLFVTSIFVLSYGGSTGLAQQVEAPGTVAISAEAKSESSTSEPAATPETLLSPVVDNFSASVTDHDLDPGAERAWEYRPYRVAVWVCVDGSPELNAIVSDLQGEITRRSELIDPCGWDLQVGPAPNQFRWRFLNFLSDAEKLSGFEDLSFLEPYDKLMVVCLDHEFGETKLRVREFDLQTRQWGPLLRRQSSSTYYLGAITMDAIKVAFMPLARVDRVIKKDNKDEVFVQVRAIDACYRTEINEKLQREVVPIKGSPVFIKNDDRFLPVIRRTDRDGKLLKLEPLEFTFLTIDGAADDASASELKCSIESYHRAPLAGRTSKRMEKLALVIRPPNQPTRLYLESMDDSKTPLEGFDVYSRRPSAQKGDPNEYLGKTDWQGMLEIPPSDEGLRIILISRGSRALKRLPVIPGFHAELRSSVPSDETSLFAQGVILGLEKEILDLVIQRQVFESDIGAALKVKKLADAKTAFKEYQALESPRDLKSRLADEEVRLKAMTEDKRETEFIIARFANLRSLVSKQINNQSESKLQSEIQKQSNLPGA